MPYFQAKELLDLQSTNVEVLLDALEDLWGEYAHIVGSIHSGFRENAEEDLIRIITLSKAIKYRIAELGKPLKHMIDLTTSSKILDYCKSKGYPIAEFNIIYVEGMSINGRLNADEPNQFNDVRCVFNSKQCLDVWQATTEPGYWYTDYPMNPNGAFRIAFGYHDRAWEISWHGNSEPHEALVQVGEVEGYRDCNRDMQRPNDQKVVGLFGINQHWGYDLPEFDIGQASAGCLVGRTRQGHQEFMEYCKNSGLDLFSAIVVPGNEIFK